MENENTTIKLSKNTKKRIDHLKEYKRESYNEIIQKILDILNLCRMNPERAKARLIEIERQKKKQEKQRKGNSQLH